MIRINNFKKTCFLVFMLGLASAAFSSANAQQAQDLSGVIRGENGQPIAAATVTVVELSQSTSSDQDGQFHFNGLPDGTYTLQVKSLGTEPVERRVVIREGKSRTLTIEMESLATQLDQVDVMGYNSHNHKTATIGKAGIVDLDLPQGVQFINEQVIEDQQVNRLADALKNANGVAMGSNRGGLNENFFARGYSLGSNNIFKNGVRTNNAVSIEASTLESIEILKGSAALLYGGVSGGAVLNVVTKKPKFEYGGEVSFRAGSYELYKPTIDVYGPISKNVAFRVIGTYENAQSFRDHVSNERTYVNPSLLIKASEKTEIEINADYLKGNNTPDFGIGSVAGKIDKTIGRNRFFNTPWAYNNFEQSNVQAALNHQFNEDWKLNVSAGMQLYNRDYFGAERIQILENGDLPIALNKTRSKEQTFNEQANLTGKFLTGSLKHTLLVGLDADQSDVTNKTFDISTEGNKTSATGASVYDIINIYEPDGMRSDIPNAPFKQSTATSIYRYGAFVQDLVEVTEKFKVLAGVRWTYQKTPYSIVTDAQGNSQPTIIEDAQGNELGAKVDKAWSPKFALIYQPIKSSSIYVSYANNFTSNSGYDKDYTPMGPSIIDQYEAGIKNDFYNGRLSVNVTGYRIVNNRFAQTIILEDGTVPDANMKEFTGKTASDGVELDVTGTLAPGLNVLAGYSYNFMRYLSTNENGAVEDVRLVGTTAHTANGTVFYTLQRGALKNLKLGASVYYTGQRNAGWNNTKVNVKEGVNRLIPVDGFTTFDFSAGYTYRQWSILAKLANIGNTFNYYVHENYSVNPIPPRSFMATLAYKFGK